MSGESAPDPRTLLGTRALAIRDAVRRGEVSATQMLEAALSVVAAENPSLNALCTPNPEAEDNARASERHLAAGHPARPLEGVPFVVKDNIETGGLRTTYGSRLTAGHVPEADALVVERLRAAGAVLVGKTNTPEFAADINTDNDVFGQTRNPWDVNRTPGGSSGGTAAAVASGMVPFGLGTDLGGSIRIPSAFNGIAGLRTAPGRVPVFPQEFGWDTLIAHVQGPMARHVCDLGLVLSVIAGPDDRDPSSLPDAGVDFLEASTRARPLAGIRVAYAGDLGGVVPVDREVAGLSRAAAHRLTRIGCTVEDAVLDGSRIKRIMTGTRAFNLVARYAHRFERSGDALTVPIANQVRSALEVDLRTVTEAERLRTEHWHEVRRLLERFDFIVTPTVGVTAFRLDQALPAEVGGQPVENFYDVILTTYAFSLTGLPALSLPCGCDSKGLPVGLQIVGPRYREDRVLALGAAYEAAFPGLFRAPPPAASQPLLPVSRELGLGGVPVTRPDH